MCGRLPGISADDSRFFLVQEELQRLLVDEAEEAEANCTVDELLSALRKTILAPVPHRPPVGVGL